jgi:hypothetical protein
VALGVNRRKAEALAESWPNHQLRNQYVVRRPWKLPNPRDQEIDPAMA